MEHEHKSPHWQLFCWTRCFWILICSQIQLHILKCEKRRGRRDFGTLKSVNTTYVGICRQVMKVQWTDLRGEPVANGVHVVAGCWGAHECVRVAGEAVAIGRQTVSRAAVSTQTSLMHGGWRQGLGPVQCTAALWHKKQQHMSTGENKSGKFLKIFLKSGLRPTGNPHRGLTVWAQSVISHTLGVLPVYSLARRNAALQRKSVKDRNDLCS